MKLSTTIAAGIVLILGASLAGCASDSGEDSSALDFWRASDSDGLPDYIESFNESSTDATVTLRELPFANYDAALNQAFNAQSGPDIVLVNSVTLGTFADAGYLADISTVVDLTGDLADSNFFPGFADSVKVNGVKYALPLDTGSRILQWNKTLFDRAGIAEFGDTVSWAEMLTAAKAIDELGDDIQGYCYAGGQNWLAIYEGVGPYVHQAGGDFFNADLTESTINSPQTVKAFEAFRDLALTGDESNVVAQETAICKEKLGAGTVGMQMGGFWSLPTEEQITGDFELGQSLPMDETVYSSTGGWTLAVPSYVSPDKYPAINAFIKDLYKPENIIKATGLFPATSNGRAAAVTFDKPLYDLYWRVLEEGSGHPIALNPELSNQATIVMKALQDVVQGGSAQDVLDQAKVDLDATLE